MNNCFNGNERLEVLEQLGRPMRKGSPEDLRVSDKSRVLAALESVDKEAALAYLELISGGHFEMLSLLYEWMAEWSNTLAKHRPDDERRYTATAFQRWQSAVSTSKVCPEAVELLKPLLDPEAVWPGASDRYRSERVQGGNGALSGLIGRLSGMKQNIHNAVTMGRFEEASGEFHSYWSLVCAVHDGLVQYAQSYPAVVGERMDQDMAERVIKESFSSCSFFEGLWALPLFLNTIEQAAFLAEHLRLHLSGADRGGSVGIIEEKDCYRLVFDPCGSGGALRRRLSESGIKTEVFEKPTPAVWGRAHEVPAYCAHCAFNELQSMERFGYPVFVTEFDPDPLKPCGWTVYKDPVLIPEEYFSRLGHRKDPAKFKR